MIANVIMIVLPYDGGQWIWKLSELNVPRSKQSVQNIQKKNCLSKKDKI